MRSRRLCKLRTAAGTGNDLKHKVESVHPQPQPPPESRGGEVRDTRGPHIHTGVGGAAEVEQQGSNITNSMQRPQQKQSHDTLGRHRTGKARGGQIRKYERAELAYATKREATAIDAGQG